MKKTLSITAALALALSLTAVASADPITGTVTNATYNSTDEPIIKPDEVVLNPTPIHELTKVTYFYNAPNGKKVGALAPQKVDTTGNRIEDARGGEWVEIYTWLGTAWIYVD